MTIPTTTMMETPPSFAGDVSALLAVATTVVEPTLLAVDRDGDAVATTALDVTAVVALAPSVDKDGVVTAALCVLTPPAIVVVEFGLSSGRNRHVMFSHPSNPTTHVTSPLAPDVQLSIRQL
jgi:hypothetical protein